MGVVHSLWCADPSKRSHPQLVVQHRGAIAAVSMNATCLGNIGKKSFERSLGTLLGGWLGYSVAMARLVKLRSPVRQARVSASGFVPLLCSPLTLPALSNFKRTLSSERVTQPLLL